MQTPASGGSVTAFDPNQSLYHFSHHNFYGSSVAGGNNGTPLGWSQVNVNTTDYTGSLWE